MAACGTRCENNERALLAATSALILLVWAILYLTDVNHPPGVRTARVAGLALTIGIGVLEWVWPWSGFCAFLVFWPQAMVLRELLQKAFGPTWSAFPAITAGPIAASLSVGFTLRNWKFDRDPARAASIVSAEKNGNAATREKWIRISLWSLAAVWGVSSVIATARLLSGPPAGWHVDVADWRHLSGPSAYSALAPAASALHFVPELLLGLLLFNDLARKDRPCVQAPLTLLLKFAAIGATLVIGEFVLQLALNFTWAFDANPPSGPFNNRNAASPILIVFSLIMLAAKAKRLAYKPVLGLLSAVAFGIACTIFSRNGLFMAGMLLVVLLTLRLQRRWIMPVLGGVILAMCLWAPLPDSKSLTSFNAVRFVATLEDLRAGNWDSVTSYRSELYRSAGKIFSANPILGTGPATFPMLTAPALNGAPAAPFAVSGHGAFYSAHSMPLNLAAETGIIGMLSWLVLWLAIPAAALWKNDKNRWFWLALLMIGVGTLLDTFWFTPGVATVSLLMLWMASADDRTKVEDRGENSPA